MQLEMALAEILRNQSGQVRVGLVPELELGQSPGMLLSTDTLRKSERHFLCR